jgi:hypothetical protein
MIGVSVKGLQVSIDEIESWRVGHCTAHSNQRRSKVWYKLENWYHVGMYEYPRYV